MKYNNQQATTDKEKANLFNEFFGSVFTEPIPNENLPPVVDDPNPLLEHIVLEEREVITALKNLDPNKANGPDQIPPGFLKECAQSLAKPLTIIFNRSLETGRVPSGWKKAKVCPIFKKGEKCDIKNYRPISLLNIVSKILERCVYNHIIDEIQPRITPFQHGFVAGKSTITQLLETYHNINIELEKRKQVDIIFLDLTKAFDSVSHVHLLTKIQRFGINGRTLEWFRSYLSNRMQYTVVNDATSTEIPVLSGVPQGSILGPLLFIIYINDMPSNVDVRCPIQLYADDSKISSTIDSYHDCYRLQEQLERLVRWSREWRLNFNASKCKIMSITRKTLPHRYYYNIEGTPLERVTSMNDLGLLVQDNLLWDEHIRGIVAKANKLMFYVKRTIGFHAPFKAKRILYMSLVRSQLEYATIIWAPFTKQNMELIERVQRRATKYICCNRLLRYKDRLLMTNLLPLTFRREVLDCQYTLKARSGVLGRFSYDLCAERTRRLNCRLDADHTKLPIKKVTSETFAHFFSNRIAHVWNSLPSHLRRMVFVPKSLRFRQLINHEFISRVENQFNSDNTCTWVYKCRCPTCRI
jgi:hypothetical protein